ncbi:MAG: gamma-glutamyl-gamma-aminobutyrate hydrolase family protein [Bacteroidetes bacterium]|nr:MAG: gamma-glutamyl-gamma-aminobutyrate hydrolase family protein [Bacteroidota bacterium]
MRIAVTDNMGAEVKFQAYINWLLNGNPNLEWVKISYKENNIHEIDSCDGVLLTGGGDIDPALYGATGIHPKTYSIDVKRDDFEREVIDETLRQEKPLLGICRGLQMINVHFGGTLIQDLDEIGHPNHSTKKEFEQTHGVVIQSEGLLADAVGVLSGIINSYHHQAADTVGEGLNVVARSDDGIIEALELKNGEARPFFLAVQWHPERMSDALNPFSQKILQRFLTEVQQR